MRDTRGDAYDSNEILRPPNKEGEPPRPSTEPKGSEEASHKAPTATDPATGAPQPSP